MNITSADYYQSLLGKAYGVMFAHWREQKKKKNEMWISDATHQCNSSDKCSITNLCASIYEYTTVHGHKDHHICLEGCVKKQLHSIGQLCITINNVFLCETTGKFHVCNKNCNEPTIRSRHSEHVCKMSGLTRGSEFHDTYTISDDKGNCALSMSRKRKLVDVIQGGGDHKKLKHENWLHALGLDTKSTNITIQMIDLLLFNKKRQQLENERLKKMRQQAMAVVITYKRRCEKAKDKSVCVMYAQWLYEDSMQKNRPPPFLQTYKQIADRIVQYYAYFCMVVYAKLVKFVFSNDDDYEDVPSLKECIPPILYIMREGLKTSNDTPLLNVDMFLDLFLPEENILNRFNIKKTQFTHVRNKIAIGTSYAIEEKHLCAAQLSVTPLSMEDILQLDGKSIHELFMEANPAILCNNK